SDLIETALSRVRGELDADSELTLPS
ncbi:MAG: hypothetical protein RLZZ17_76, partial [Actinomycetota bacterium]